jgi:hypothetical protein
MSITEKQNLKPTDRNYCRSSTSVIYFDITYLYDFQVGHLDNKSLVEDGRHITIGEIERCGFFSATILRVGGC